MLLLAGDGDPSPLSVHPPGILLEVGGAKGIRWMGGAKGIKRAGE